MLRVPILLTTLTSILVWMPCSVLLTGSLLGSFSMSILLIWTQWFQWQHSCAIIHCKSDIKLFEYCSSQYGRNMQQRLAISYVLWNYFCVIRQGWNCINKCWCGGTNSKLVTIQKQQRSEETFSDGKLFLDQGTILSTVWEERCKSDNRFHGNRRHGLICPREAFSVHSKVRSPQSRCGRPYPEFETW